MTELLSATSISEFVSSVVGIEFYFTNFTVFNVFIYLVLGT